MERRIQGQTDTELHKTGRDEARQLAKELKKLNIDGIVASGLKRSIQTAEIFSKELRVPVVKKDTRLNECSHGSLDGMTRQEITIKYGEDLIQKQDDRSEYDFTPFGGENRLQILMREHALLNDIKNEFAGKTMLLVGHGRALNTLLGDLGIQKSLKRGEYIEL